MSFSRLSPLLKKSLKVKGISQKMAASLICEDFDKEIVGIFGKQILKETKALYYKNQTLTVRVVHSVLASELRLRQNEILKKLNQKTPEKIKKIQLLLKQEE